MKHVTGELHLGGAEGVVWGETEDGREHTALKTRVLWSPKIRKQEKTEKMLQHIQTNRATIYSFLTFNALQCCNRANNELKHSSTDPPLSSGYK